MDSVPGGRKPAPSTALPAIQEETVDHSRRYCRHEPENNIIPAGFILVVESSITAVRASVPPAGPRPLRNPGPRFRRILHVHLLQHWNPRGQDTGRQKTIGCVPK